MNILYTLNYFIFSIFLTLFILEIGVALLALLSYKIYTDKLKKYILPMWEINGTFAVFYLVNFEVTYPKLLTVAGTVYVFPALLAALLLIIRNSFIAYSEYVSRVENEKLYIKIYGIATLIIAILTVSILTSSVTGMGINLSTSTINSYVLLLNPYNILMLISILLFTLFIAVMFFDIIKFTKKIYLLLVLAFGLFLISNYAFVPYLFSNIAKMPYLIAISLIILGLSIFYKVRESRISKFLVILWFIVSINLFGILEFPYMFGKGIDVTQYMATSQIAGAASIITVIGGIFVGISLLYLIFLNSYKKKKED